MDRTTEPLHLAIVSRRVHPAHGPGGLERHVYDQVVHLAGAGVQVELYSELPRDQARVAALEAAVPSNVQTHWVRRGPLPIGRARGTVVLDRITNYPLWARRLARSLHRQPDVLHVHGLAGLGFAERRHAFSCPLVLTTQGMEEFRAPGRIKHAAYAPFRAGIRRVAAASDRVIVTDEALVPVVQGELNLPDERLRVIPNAINPRQCTDQADAGSAAALLDRLGILDAAPLFISVGRVAPNKGFALLVEALAAAALRLPDGWRWLLVGDGPERPAVEAAISAAGLGERCRLVGAVDDGLKHGLLAAADWFVHPTLYEGSSLVTLEAMAHRLPVLATRTGGLPDKVREGETGFLVEPGDRDLLAAGIVGTAGADGAALGVAGRRLLDEHFSWDAVTPLFLALYEELLTA